MLWHRGLISDVRRILKGFCEEECLHVGEPNQMFGWGYCCRRKVNQLLNVQTFFSPLPPAQVYVLHSVKTGFCVQDILFCCGFNEDHKNWLFLSPIYAEIIIIPIKKQKKNIQPMIVFFPPSDFSEVSWHNCKKQTNKSKKQDWTRLTTSLQEHLWKLCTLVCCGTKGKLSRRSCPCDPHTQQQHNGAVGLGIVGGWSEWHGSKWQMLTPNVDVRCHLWSLIIPWGMKEVLVKLR